MRDAFGGAFSIKLMLIFLILYVSFICVALNYARAFRVKNRIINIIEQNEGYCGSYTADVNRQIINYLDSTGYRITYDQVKNKVGDNNTYTCLNDFKSNDTHGFCIYNKSRDITNQICTEPNIYTVETYMVFTIPIINIKFPIVIKGETRVVERIS